MIPRKRFLALLSLSFLFASCHGRLPRSLRDEIAAEKGRLSEATAEIQRAQDEISNAIQKDPALFNNAPAVTAWQASLATDRQKLDSAKREDVQLDQIAHANRADSRIHAEELLSEERDLRYAAVHDAESVQAQADKWLAVDKDPNAYVTKLQAEYDAIHSQDLAAVTSTVEKAEEDWPKKKSDLALRLDQLTNIQKSAASEWQETDPARRDAASGKLTGADIAVLVKTEDEFTSDADTLHRGVTQLPQLSNQLYVAWDKVLIDLDKAREDGRDVYREKIKTVRTHFNDALSAKADTTSDEHWVDVSRPSFDLVENDLGMAIAHKDAGLYDSEATTTPQPAGFAYIASPAEGHNQYGYWTHENGQSFWTFLPEYLILRELMWGHDYRPIVVGEYEGYRVAQRAGTTFYGRETTTGLPKYGSHGTFTQTRYAGSRYVQSGGFRGSAYASRGSSSFSSNRPSPGSSAFDSSGAGKRFGASPGSSAGRRFGGGGFRSPGRSFGRRR